MTTNKSLTTRFSANAAGFTLIELLVVIAIIGMLAAVIVVSLNSARTKGRDARRLSDARQIMTALELYYNDNGGYPVASGTAPSTRPSASAGSPTFSTYLPIYPTYPSPSGANCGSTYYTYTRPNAEQYTVVFCLENATGGLAAGTHTASQTGIK
jgi:prepilin-type N-terminal cleavage/methylation domain-containing protein